MSKAVEFWAVVPAAGTGSRMQTDIPKQYLQLNGKPVIEHTLKAFCANEKIKGIVVAISEQDTWWKKLGISSHPKIKTTTGGDERCHSVINCLRSLAAMAAADDWVLVHDAARPCINSGDIDHLIGMLVDHPVGGLLALPVRDTMKRADMDNVVCDTVNRDGLWHALTPQMFRLALLTQALQQAIDRNQVVTDESQAMELTGLKPLLVEGQASNIKITRKDDLALAELYLRQVKYF
jgi:2-C-methyl-D-erythritol 4-phosphate cytidylyltransferase